MTRTNKGRKDYRPPFGYSQHPTDRQIFIADYEKLYALEKALEYVEEGSTFRDAATWLRATTGEYVSHVFLYYERRKRQLQYEKSRRPHIKRLTKKIKEDLLDGARQRAASENKQG